MKTAIVYALALVALVHGELHSQANLGFGLHNISLYKRLLRTRSVGEGENGQTQLCVANSTKTEGCNTCVCAQDGSRWACFEVACVHGETKVENSGNTVQVQAGQSPPVRRRLRPLPPPHITYCRRNTVYMKDCNRCHCPPSGRGPTCRRKPCP